MSNANVANIMGLQLTRNHLPVAQVKTSVPSQNKYLFPVMAIFLGLLYAGCLPLPEASNYPTNGTPVKKQPRSLQPELFRFGIVGSYYLL